MKSKMSVLILSAATLLLAGCLGPSSPEEQLVEIKEMQAKKLPMTDAQKTGLEESLAKGREALASGNKEAAMTAFGAAIDILKKAEDTALYNKAD